MICVLALLSCNGRESEPMAEDYEKMFPFSGIEKPESLKGDLVVKPCDPDLALEQYKYPGEDEVGEDTYEVILTCEFNEVDNSGVYVNRPTARYTVSYINDEKALVEISSQSPEEDGTAYMRNGIPLEVRFRVRSGFPMYLTVNGVGPRNSNVKASIRALSSDGLVEIPALSTEQYQNEEGPNKLRNPYCEYIILP